MNPLSRFIVATMLAAVSLLACNLILAEEKPAEQSKRAWTLAEAEAQLALQPHDPYLQYVVLQLARRQNKQDEYATKIADMLGGQQNRRGRTDRVDLFSIFAGALAVQESLQLDTMRGERRPRNNPNAPPPGAGPILTIKTNVPVREMPKPVEAEKGGASTVVQPAATTVYQEISISVPLMPVACAMATGMAPVTSSPLETTAMLVSLGEDPRRREIVDLGTLHEPEIKSHPWEKLLAGRKPEVPSLARCVPDDFYFAEFRSLNKLMEAMEISDLWSTHLFNQALREARTQRTGERLKEQLVLPANDVLRPFYDQVVEQVAVTGSDLYLREGSDVTLLFQLKQPAAFRSRLDALFNETVK